MSQTSPPRTPRASAGPLTEKRTNLPLNVSPLRKAGKHSMLGDDGGSPRAAAIPKGAPTQGDDDLKGELRSLEYTKEDRAAGPSSGLPPRFRKRAAKTKAENSADTPQTAPRSRVHDDQTSLKTTDGERPAPANEGEGEVPSSVPAVRVGTDAPAGMLRRLYGGPAGALTLYSRQARQCLLEQAPGQGPPQGASRPPRSQPDGEVQRSRYQRRGAAKGSGATFERSSGVASFDRDTDEVLEDHRHCTAPRLDSRGESRPGDR
ncbi:hypothetical protein PLICRDRAFT_487480 [Plicaturopsis crispa FD-325 SS-3]|nr:hypothetical protein PLICRDRAFT_487480 [Plicaturopsis crispa FD-325 SS-3]